MPTFWPSLRDNTEAVPLGRRPSRRVIFPYGYRPITGTFHDPRNVGRSFHSFACHSSRDREWTDCCGRDVRLAQVARHDCTVSFHHGTDQRVGVLFFPTTASRRLWVLGSWLA